MQGAHRVHHRTHRTQVLSERVPSFRFHHEVRAVISQSTTDGTEGAAGIDHIVDGIKRSDEVKFGGVWYLSGQNPPKLHSVSHPLSLGIGACSLQGFFADIKTVET